MKITLKETPEQIELIKAVGAKDKVKSMEAQEVFASFIGPVIQQVLMVAGTSSMLYTDVKYDEDDSPSYPLDLYYDQPDTLVTTWSQSIAGGMPTNQVEGVKEMKLATYVLDCAVSLNKSYMRKSRLDVVSKALNRMANEVLIKQERNAWSVLLRALAEATTLGSQHLIRCGTPGLFLLDDLNKLMTRYKRVNAAYNQGTTDMANSFGITDLVVSPEIKEQIRAFSYNPLNTRVGVAAGTSSAGYTATAVPLPDAIREDIYGAAGAQEIFGIGITDINEFGIGFKYNTLMTTYAGSTAFTKSDGSASATFSNSTEQILFAMDTTRDAAIRPVAVNSDTGSTFVAQPDDQFFLRQDKVGFFGSLQEGRIVIDSRSIVGLIV